MKVAALFFAISLLASPAGSPATPEELLFSPAEGLVLVRTFEAVSSTEGESSSPRGPGSSTSSSERTLVVTDEIGAVEDGRILHVERTLDAISSTSENSMESSGRAREWTTEGSCEIEGATIVFEWNDDEQEYVASSAEVDDDVLDELVFDYDFTALLPEDEVEQGDEWDLDVEAFRNMMDPWEGLPWEWSDDGGRSVSGSDERGEPDVDENESGEIVATFVELREVEGVDVAVLSLEGELEIERTVDATSEFELGSSTTHTETTESHEIQGEALWDIAAGRLHSLEIEVELSTSRSMVGTVVIRERERAIDSDHESSGTVTFSVSIALAE